MATGTLTTVADKTIGDVFTEAMYDDYLKDNLNQLIGLRSRNLLTNGGFEVWQRGAGPFTTTTTYGPDRWIYTFGGAGPSMTKETTIIDTASAASLKVVSNFTSQFISQKIEDYAQLRGQTISFSCRVRQSVASGARLALSGSSFTALGSTSATTGAFVTLTVSGTVGAADTGPVTATIEFLLGAGGTFYLDNAMLVMGPAPTEYVPLHPQEELARCQRYYEVHGGVSGAMYSGGYNTAGGGAVIPFRFSAPKGGTPTVTKNGTWAVTNCGQPTVAASDAGGYSLQAVVTATGAYSFNCNSSDDLVEAIWNP